LYAGISEKLRGAVMVAGDVASCTAVTWNAGVLAAGTAAFHGLVPARRTRHTGRMPEEVYAIGAVISLLATIAGVWSAWRRRQIERRIIASLTDEQRKIIGLAPRGEREPETKK
jgi:hypothetical protein